MSEQSVYAIAKECVESAKWDADKALSAMLGRVTDDPQVSAALIERGCRSYIAAIAANRRSALLGGSGTEREGLPDTNATVRAFRGGYLDTYPIGGKPMGLASAEDLRESIAFHRTTAGAHQAHADFEEAVLSAMKKGKKVAECLKEEQIKALAAKYPKLRAAA